MSYQFDHLSMNSPTPEKTAEFYVKNFGAKITKSYKVPDGRTIVNAVLGDTKFSITSPRPKPLNPNAVKTGFEHFGVKTDNLEKALADLKANGARQVTEIVPIPGGRMAFVVIPEDTYIEVIEEK